MRITEAKVENGWMMLKVSSIQDAYKFRMTFKEGNYDIVPHKNKRSRNANDYAWALMTRISEKIGIPPEDVYKNEIRDICGKTTMVWVESDDIQREIAAFTAGHIGRYAEVIEDDGQTACILKTYGSSDYNTKEMSQLIENILQDCRELDIETKDPEYVRSLLESWHA